MFLLISGVKWGKMIATGLYTVETVISKTVEGLAFLVIRQT